jgi:hypothetical protein
MGCKQPDWHTISANPRRLARRYNAFLNSLMAKDQEIAAKEAPAAELRSSLDRARTELSEARMEVAALKIAAEQAEAAARTAEERVAELEAGMPRGGRRGGSAAPGTRGAPSSNPERRGRPGPHLRLPFLQEAGQCIGQPFFLPVPGCGVAGRRTGPQLAAEKASHSGRVLPITIQSRASRRGAVS